MIHVRIPAELRDLKFSTTSRLLLNANQELFRSRKRDRVVRLIVYLNLEPTLRMGGVIPLLPLHALMTCTETNLSVPLALYLSPHFVISYSTPYSILLLSFLTPGQSDLVFYVNNILSVLYFICFIQYLSPLPKQSCSLDDTRLYNRNWHFKLESFGSIALCIDKILCIGILTI
jgi:hypothetical protein